MNIRRRCFTDDMFYDIKTIDGGKIKKHYFDEEKQKNIQQICQFSDKVNYAHILSLAFYATQNHKCSVWLVKFIYLKHNLNMKISRPEIIPHLTLYQRMKLQYLCFGTNFSQVCIVNSCFEKVFIVVVFYLVNAIVEHFEWQKLSNSKAATFCMLAKFRYFV